MRHLHAFAFASASAFVLLSACASSTKSTDSTNPAESSSPKSKLKPSKAQLQAQAKAWIGGKVENPTELKSKGHSSIQGDWTIDVDRTLEANAAGAGGEAMSSKLKEDAEEVRGLVEKGELRITVDEFAIHLILESEDEPVVWLYRIEDVQPGRATLVLKPRDLGASYRRTPAQAESVILTCTDFETCVGEWPSMRRVAFRRLVNRFK